MATGVVEKPKTKRTSFVVKTMAEVADFFGVTRAAVHQWTKEQDPVPASRTGYDLSKVAQWLRRQRGGGDGLSDELKAAEIRLKTVQAQQKELDLSVKKRELIPLADVELWAATTLIETREMVMTLPEVLATSSPPDSREFIRSESDRHCRSVLTMLRRRLEADIVDNDEATDD